MASSIISKALDYMYNLRFPEGNITSISAFISAVQALPNTTIGIFPVNGATGRELGVNDSGIVLAKNFTTDNAINYVIFGKSSIATGSIVSTTGVITIGKTY